MPTPRWWLIVYAVTAAGCGSIGPVPTSQVAAVDTVPSIVEPVVIVHPVEREPVHTDVWVVLRNGFVLDHETDEPSVARALSIYRARPPMMLDIETRARRYLPYVVDEVRQRQLPMELALVPIIESTLNPYASSHRGASGLWQLIPRTAKQYGVTIDWWYDGRRDLVDSTTAALDYLSYLHDEFGDWTLAIAAYNGGEGRVRRALAARPGMSFFDLDLPLETRRYVPRLLALAHLIAEGDTQLLPPIDPAPAFFSATLVDQIDLTTLANIGSLPVDEMFSFNAGLNRRATPPGGSYRLLIPLPYREAFESALSQYPKDRVTWRLHAVKRGESLEKIARQHRTTVAAIRSANALTNDLIRPKQSLLIAVNAIEPAALPANPMLAAARTPAGRRTTYTVRRGDSLSHIAVRFNVSISAIADWNDIDPSEILKPGRRLVIHISTRRNTS